VLDNRYMETTETDQAPKETVAKKYKAPRTVEKPALSNEDQASISWFFTDGQCAFERSPCGPMLDALERDSCTSMPCRKCRGAGICGESDWLDPESGQWCTLCNGTGTLPVVMKRSKHALTAKPTKSNAGSNAKAPENFALTTYAFVSRRINLMQVFAPVSVQVLAAYFGDSGYRWAQQDGRGRIFPVIALTKAGATLIKRSQGRTILQDQESDVPRDAHEQLGQLFLVESVQSDPNRAKLFTAGFKQAETLYDQAILDWNSTAKR
jgi:hypothetical protein